MPRTPAEVVRSPGLRRRSAGTRRLPASGLLRLPSPPGVRPCVCLPMHLLSILLSPNAKCAVSGLYRTASRFSASAQVGLLPSHPMSKPGAATARRPPRHPTVTDSLPLADHVTMLPAATTLSSGTEPGGDGHPVTEHAACADGTSPSCDDAPCFRCWCPRQPKWTEVPTGPRPHPQRPQAPCRRTRGQRQPRCRVAPRRSRSSRGRPTMHPSCSRAPAWTRTNEPTVTSAKIAAPSSMMVNGAGTKPGFDQGGGVNVGSHARAAPPFRRRTLSAHSECRG